MSVEVSPGSFQNGTTSSNGQGLHLPKISHPNLRVADPNSINVTARAVSRSSSLGELVDRYRNDNSRTRPMDREASFHTTRRSNEENFTSASFNVPEGIRAIYTPDVNKVSIPIFGN